ncbi:ATP-binding protein, partial [Aliarcobacter butzleri]
KVSEALVDVLITWDPLVIGHSDAVQKKYSTELFAIYNALESNMEKIAHESDKDTKRKKSLRSEESQSLLGAQIEKCEYDTFWMDPDAIYK